MRHRTRTHIKENLLVIACALLMSAAVLAALNWMVPFGDLWGLR